ncbi:MAG: TIGR02186 family protein [Rhodospirillaceae bacterium]|jgi:uncharacterized protein (TIGR02186 family)|nr:TIGR02186 family protein [Rhodospirillaceae bacterium]MBT3927087.1 TIGR02186 family protein [Rhodospirillaceae bacterium]MBT4428367.1 TIGR02186 family protein [Rhodospirillaceae bacterium]MBT5038828.1 TIGR02186 family protein [Rhodospirillaceae bacterium]MBT5677512.1 TIGR02186 family protein [Rhodospirillaceae bacterium]
MTGRMPFLALLLILCGGLSAPADADDTPLLVDISPQTIEVDSSFHGTTIILFGVKSLPGDIIITLRGPEAPIVVRRKRVVAGIWINRDSVAFRDVPQYYALAASRPIDEIMTTEELNRNQIGSDHILLNTIWSQTTDEVSAFREAVWRARTQDALYAPTAGEVVITHDSLFRATLKLPGNVPIGDYVAETLLVRDGEVLSRRESQLKVEKSGISAEIYDFAKGQGALYGLLAIAAALVAGWVGGVAFRKN